LKLLHYEADRNGHRSRVDIDAFFLSAEGRGDPVGELAATAAAFRADADASVPASRKPWNLPAACVFPARYDFVRATLDPRLPASPDCPDLDRWEARLAARGAVLVYASAYANNPASMFGHALIRIEAGDAAAVRAGDAGGLLGYGVAFAAKTDDRDDPVSYMMRGLFGGYPGYFDVQPYYDVVNSYNNVDSRDLWEYRLALTPEELRRLVRHSWELMSAASFDYYFFDENCAFQILSLLEAAAPRLSVLDDFGAYVLPVTVLRRLAEAGLLDDAPKRRPAVKRQMNATFAALSDAERARVDQALASGALPNDASRVELDALAEWLNFRVFATRNQLDAKERGLRRETLLARAKVPDQSEIARVALPTPSRPDESHGNRALDMSVGGAAGAERTTYVALGGRVGMQDFLAPRGGYEPFAQIDFLAAELRFDQQPPTGETRRVRAGRATLVEVTSLHPWSDLDPQLSWRMAVTGGPPLDLVCGARCWEGRAEAGGGLALGPSSESFLVYGLALGRVAGVDRGEVKARFGPAATLGAIVSPHGAWRVLLDGDLWWSLRRDALATRVGLGQALDVGGDWEARLGLWNARDPGEGGAAARGAELMLRRRF
jgi:hypothetical protein